MNKYTEFTTGLLHKVFLNLFDFATDKTDIYNLIDIVFENTTANQTDLLFENSEFLFIWANALYLFNEASEDAQNMFMMLSLFAAGISDSEQESDLDRLFEMLREKKPDCITIEKYDDFKACSGGIRNAVIQSCIKRIAPVCYEDDIIKNISNLEITEFVDTFISNSQRCEHLNDKICSKAEYNLILSVFDYVYQQKNQGEMIYGQISKILDDVYMFFNSVKKSNPTSSYCISFNKFYDFDKDEQERAISNFRLRSDFWKTFK